MGYAAYVLHRTSYDWELINDSKVSLYRCFRYTFINLYSGSLTISSLEHTDRIRNMMENNVNMTSGLFSTVISKTKVELHIDWMAHTILDTIVDSFFPILGEIDQEARAIDQMVFTETASPQLEEIESSTKIPLTVPDADAEPKQAEKLSEIEITTIEKRTLTDRTPSFHTRFASPRLSIPLLFRRARRHLHRMRRGFWSKATSPGATRSTLRRIARVKKLIVVLGRLLSSKSDLMTGIKKRIIKALESKTEGTTHKQPPEEVEIVMYMTDIQGELSLTHSLVTHCFPDVQIIFLHCSYRWRTMNVCLTNPILHICPLSALSLK